RRRARAPPAPRRSAARRDSDAFLVDLSAAAVGAEHIQAATDGIPASRMRALLALDGLEQLQPFTIEAADDARVADRDVEPLQLAVEHDDVGHSRQRQLCDDLAAI